MTHELLDIIRHIIRRITPNPRALSLREAFISFLVIFGISVFSCWLMFSTFSSREGTFYFNGKVWSDFGGHIQMIRSFSMGANFPPEYPTFPGPPISYHFLFYLVIALLEKAGMNIAWATNLLSAAGFGLLLWMIYLLGRMFFSSTAAGILAMFLFLFNGTLDGVVFFEKHPLNWYSFLEIVTAKDFVSFGPWRGVVAAFWTLNIYINQRHLALSYAIILLLLWPLFRFTLQGKITNQRALLFVALSGIWLPLLHKSIIPITVLYAGVWMVFYPRTIKTFLWFYLLLFWAGLPFSFYLKGEIANQPVVQLGFLAQPCTWKAWFRFWWFNLGLYCFIIPVVFFWGKKAVKSWMLAGMMLFALSNIFRFSTEMFNNHKFLNFFILGMQVATAGWLVRLWQKGRLLKIITGLLFVGLTFSGVIDLFPILNESKLFMHDRPKSDSVDWIARNTAKRAVFLPSVGFYNPASLAGRKLYCGYTYFPWSMGYPVYERERVVVRMFAPELDGDALCRLLKIEGINYVIIAPAIGDWPKVDARQSFIYRKWDPVFVSKEGNKIYDVQAQCAPGKKLSETNSLSPVKPSHLILNKP